MQLWAYLQGTVYAHRWVMSSRRKAEGSQGKEGAGEKYEAALQRSGKGQPAIRMGEEQSGGGGERRRGEEEEEEEEEEEGGGEEGEVEDREGAFERLEGDRCFCGYNKSLRDGKTLLAASGPWVILIQPRLLSLLSPPVCLSPDLQSPQLAVWTSFSPADSISRQTRFKNWTIKVGFVEMLTAEPL